MASKVLICQDECTSERSFKMREISRIVRNEQV